METITKSFTSVVKTLFPIFAICLQLNHNRIIMEANPVVQHRKVLIVLPKGFPDSVIVLVGMILPRKT